MRNCGMEPVGVVVVKGEIDGNRKFFCENVGDHMGSPFRVSYSSPLLNSIYIHSFDPKEEKASS